MTDSNSIYRDHAIDGVEDQYLVYVLYRDEGIPHYVGATSNSRRPYNKRHHARQDHTITSVEIVQECMTLEDASILEDHLINEYGRQVDGGTLVNVQGGGRGLATEETKRKIGQASKGRPSPNKGKPMTDEQKTKIRQSLKGRPGTWPPNKGKPMSEEQKAKISLAKKGVPKSDEHKTKLSQSQKGRTLSEEQKAKIRAGQSARWARLKQSSLK